MTTTITRIYHRFDTLSNWETAVANGAGKLARGEIGIARDGDAAQGRIGINETPTAFTDCPIVLNGFVEVEDNEVVAVSATVVYDQPASSLPDGATVSWDAEVGKWVVQVAVLSLDEYPTESGTVVYDAIAEKFTVGAAVEADEIDGGTYEEAQS